MAHIKPPRLDTSGLSMVNFVNNICERIGPRPGGSDEEQKAGDLLFQEFDNFCDEVEKQEFSCHPQGFLDFIWITTLFYFLAFLSYFLINPFISTILLLIAFGVYFVQQNLLFEVVDFLFPRKFSFHIISKIKPKNKAKKLILLSAHYDSAYEFPLLSKLGEKTILLIILLIMIVTINIFLAILKFSLFPIFNGFNDPFGFLRNLGKDSITNNIDLIQLILFITGIIILLILSFFLRSNKSVLGANDNLSGIAAIMECGKYLVKNKPQKTEVWLICFAGEEHMRGSKRFVTKFRDELKKREAMLLNLECLSSDRFLLATAENMFLAKHSSLVVKKVNSAANKLNIPIVVQPLRFAGSDAANFSRKKLHATTLFGMSSKGIPHYWHTLEDTPDKLDGTSMAKACEISLQFIYDTDSE